MDYNKTCIICGKSFTTKFKDAKTCSKECAIKSRTEKNLERNAKLRESNLKSERWKCCVCGEVFPTRRAKQLHNKEFHPEVSVKGYCFHKGKTKDTCESIRKSIETRKKNIASGKTTSWWKGKHHSEESRKKISEKMRAYYQEHPEEFPFRKAHYTNGESYAEKYFREWLEKEGIEHKCQYSISSYHLDFLIGNIDLEIDGEQHYNFSRIAESDERRTKFLEDNGFQVIRIRWKHYQQLSENERHTFLEELKKSLLSQTGLPDNFKLVDKKVRKIIGYCPICGKEITGYRNQKYCSNKCARSRYTTSNVEKLHLLSDITDDEERRRILKEAYEKLGNMLAMGKHFGVSDNTIRKWFKKYGLEWKRRPRKKVNNE